MEKQYKDSTTSDSAGYKANTPIGNYEQSPELGKEYGQINMAYPVASVPTPDNSKRKTDSSQLPANQDSPAPVGNSSC